jgi:Xaa-Pro aminopeptidase
MRHTPIPSQLFEQNRNRLRALLPPNALAVVNANDVLPTNADGTLVMTPNSDLFYLSGIEQEESILLIAPDAFEAKRREILFLRETNDHLVIWEGHKLTKNEARKISGIQQVEWLSAFPTLFHQLMCEVEHVFLNTNEHRRAVVEVETRDARFIRKTRAAYPLHQYHRLARLMHQLRVVKSAGEIDLIRQACAITRTAFLRVLKKVKPGVNECELEAEFAHEFIRSRARFAYPPIIASGAHSCVLHYLQNDQPCRKGDLLLMDVGASYANYNADLTRTLPVNGRFTKRQRQVYESVLYVLRTLCQTAMPGVLHRDWQTQAEALMTEELLKLGLLKPAQVKRQDPNNPACKKYFMHGLGHPLGLDVHDVGFLNQPFAPGWVLTVEPGLYIPGEGFGIRLENDIVVSADGPIDLMADIPIEAEQIEELMAKGR